MSLSIRTRFEVFKRDDFTCQYCGRKSPAVVLQVDHIVAVANGGSDDPINLRTSCWDCNCGKSDVPLVTVSTGEDPHDRAVALLEQERQLHEYNAVLERGRLQREFCADGLIEHWCRDIGGRVTTRERSWLLNVLKQVPAEKVREFMDTANARSKTDGWRYVMACVRYWREENPAQPVAHRTYSHEDLVQRLADYQAFIFEQVRSAEYHRRHIGHCPHSPHCESFFDCVLRFVNDFLESSGPSGDRG